MDILVCFKLIPDYDLLAPDDWQVDSQLSVDTSFVKTMINPFDESALEIALRLRDQAKKANRDVCLSALTIDGQPAERILKTLHALQYDQAVRIDHSSEANHNPEAIGKHICNFLDKKKIPDIILMGSKAPPGDNSLIPYLVAEELGIPCISPVSELSLSETNECLEVTSHREEEIFRHTVKPPVVLVIGNTTKCFLRIPTLKDRLNCAKKEILVLPGSDDSNQNKLCVLTELKKTGIKRDCEILDGNTPLEHAESILAYVRKAGIKL